MKKILFITAIIFLFAIKAFANGTVSSVFLIVDTSARCAGMGGACVATPKDSSVVNINPAGMNFVGEKQIVAMHNETVLDLSQEYISYVDSRKEKSFGVSLVYMDMGAQQRYTSNNTFTGSFRPNSYSLNAAYSIRYNEKWNFGAAVKYVHEEIDTEEGNAIGFDFGALYEKSPKWNFGFVVQNVGTKISIGDEADSLPRNFRIGASYKWDKNLIVNSDIYMIKGSSPEYHLGAEYQIGDSVFVRTGYNSADDLDNGFSFGLGFEKDKFGVDYAYVPMGVFGDSHRFSIKNNF